jgi:hypothetical protein
MKITRFLCLLILLFVGDLSAVSAQTYNFSKRKKSIYYESSSGKTEYKMMESTVGSYKFVYEVSNMEGKNYPLFTLYYDGERNGWFGELQKQGYKEKDGIIYNLIQYLSTSDNQKVLVGMSADHQHAFIFWSDGDIVEYSN